MPGRSRDGPSQQVEALASHPEVVLAPPERPYQPAEAGNRNGRRD
jgi:hypothetical protein